MRLAERLDEIAVALEMFPKCVYCGGDLSTERVLSLVVPADHPRRFAHRVCPKQEAAD